MEVLRPPANLTVANLRYPSKGGGAKSDFHNGEVPNTHDGVERIFLREVV
jgi:hypothetical protein